MPEYIDREELLERLKRRMRYYNPWIDLIIKGMEPVGIVRCNECRHHKRLMCSDYLWCDKYEIAKREDGYCDKGVKQ